MLAQHCNEVTISGFAHLYVFWHGGPQWYNIALGRPVVGNLRQDVSGAV
jgi:hypothetical protein